jgi:hypothetical protein
MSKHKRLSASKAPRWSRCAGSPLDGDSPPTFDSSLGTAQHSASERLLKLGLDTDALNGAPDWSVEGFKGPVDDEFKARVQWYLDYVRREPGSKLYEVALECPDDPDRGGTGDTIALDTEIHTISVIDAKFGFIQVDALDNEQLQEYGYAAMTQFDYVDDWQFVRVVVAQPRLDHYDEHTYTRAEMEAFGKRMKDAAHRARYAQQFSDAERQALMTPGPKQCQWCPIKASCAARTKAVIDMFPITSDAISVSFLPTMSEADVADALDRLDFIEDWIKDLKAEALRRAQGGLPIPRYKMVNGRAGNRAWVSKSIAEGVLAMLLPEEQLYMPREIISPTEAEKLMKKKMPAEWAALNGNEEAGIPSQIFRPEGKPTLVHENSKKQALQASAVEFADITKR